MVGGWLHPPRAPSPGQATSSRLLPIKDRAILRSEHLCSKVFRQKGEQSCCCQSEAPDFGHPLCPQLTPASAATVAGPPLGAQMELLFLCVNLSLDTQTLRV